MYQIEIFILKIIKKISLLKYSKKNNSINNNIINIKEISKHTALILHYLKGWASYGF